MSAALSGPGLGSVSSASAGSSAPSPARSSDRARSLGRRIRAYAAAAPGTSLYLVVIATTSWVLATSGGRIDRALLRGHSSNLEELARDPLHGLIQSAFWVEGWPMLVVAVALGAVLAPVERRLGTPRWALVFMLGHVVATLLVATVIYVAIRMGQAPPGIRAVVDVGASYGFGAVAGVAAHLIPRPAGRWYAVSVLLALAAVLVLDRSFTDLGHLLAFAVGIACAPLARGARGAAPA